MCRFSHNIFLQDKLYKKFTQFGLNNILNHMEIEQEFHQGNNILFHIHKKSVHHHPNLLDNKILDHKDLFLELQELMFRNSLLHHKQYSRIMMYLQLRLKTSQ